MVLSPSTPSADLYAATCNPPRKAKRARVETDTVNTIDPTRPADNSRTTAPQRVPALAPRTLPVPQTVSPHNVRIRPAPASVQLSTSPKDQGSQSTRSGTTQYAQNTNRSNTTTAVINASQIIPSSASNSALNNNSQLPPPPNAPKKRGRKPTGTSRSQREALRKINHSKIEKARRSKINTALDALKKLVPSDYGKSKDSNNDMDNSARETGEAAASSSSTTAAKTSKKEEKEREFKLDILERTVLFVQDLVEKVERLEQQVQTHSGSGSGSGVWVKDGRSRSGSGSLSRGTCVCGRPYPRVGTPVVRRTIDADAVEDDGDEERDLDVDAEQSEDEEDQDEEVETDDEDIDKDDNNGQPEVVTKPKSTSLRDGTVVDDVVMADASRVKTKAKTMTITREQDDVSEAEERIHAPAQMSSSRGVNSTPDTRARAQTQTQAQAQAPTYTRPSMSLSPAHTHTSTSASDSNSSSHSRKIRPSSSTVTLPSISSWLGTVSNFTSSPSHHGSAASISPALLPRLGSSSSLTSSSSSRLQQHAYSNSSRGYTSPGIHPNTTTGTGLLTPALTGSTNATTTNPHTHIAATDTPLTYPVASPPLTIMTPASGALGVVNGDVTPPSPFSIGPSRTGLGGGGGGGGVGGVELRGVAPYTAPGALGMMHSGAGVYGHARGQASAGGTSAEDSTNSPNMSMLPPPASPYPVASSSSVYSMSRTGESMYSSPRVHAQGQAQGQGQGRGQSHSWSGKKSKKRGIDESERDVDRNRDRDGDVLMTDRTCHSPSSGSRESFVRSPVVEPVRSRAGSMPQVKTQVRRDVHSTQIIPPPTISSQRVQNTITSPSPSTSIPTHTYAHSRSQPPSMHTSPVVNWTREDESAASLLLHMSTSPVVGRGRSVSGTPAGLGSGGVSTGDGDKDKDVPELVLQMSESTTVHQQKTRTRHEDRSKTKEHSAVMQMDTVHGRTTETSRSTSPQSVGVTTTVSGLVGVGVGAHTPGSLLGIRPIGTSGRSQESE